MDFKELKQQISSYAHQDLDQRKHWYSAAAAAYNQARPHYPQALIQQVVEITQLSSQSRLLEVGCGPATATVGFAPLGCSMVCLEPNPNFFQLAQDNCQAYAKITLQNTSFEEWAVDAGQFDAVLAATSFHWIPAEVGYLKAATALRDNGHLILLWNKELQPSYDIYQCLAEVYQAHAPALNRYEDQDTQLTILQGLGQIIIDSGYFTPLTTGHIETAVTYTTDEYLTLLNTYSPYLKLEPPIKTALFQGLRDRIEGDFDGSLQLSYISAFHIAQKC